MSPLEFRGIILCPKPVLEGDDLRGRITLVKNKTLLGFIAASFLINAAFLVFLFLFLAFDGKQPYLALFITFLMFAYHIDVRLLSGALVSAFKGKINIEKKSHRISEKEYRRLTRLKVKKWKDRFPTLFKKQFSLDKEGAVDEVLRSCINAEIVHWLCLVLGLGAIPLGCLLSLDELWLYALTSLLALLFFDLPFILIQRYNRFRLYKVKDRLDARERQRAKDC